MLRTRRRPISPPCRTAGEAGGAILGGHVGPAWARNCPGDRIGFLDHRGFGAEQQFVDARRMPRTRRDVDHADIGVDQRRRDLLAFLGQDGEAGAQLLDELLVRLIDGGVGAGALGGGVGARSCGRPRTAGSAAVKTGLMATPGSGAMKRRSGRWYQRTPCVDAAVVEGWAAGSSGSGLVDVVMHSGSFRR